MPEIKKIAGNLIRATSAEKIIRPAGFYLSIALDAFVLGSAVLSGFFYRGYLRNDISVFWVVFFFFLFALASVFGMLLTKNLTRRLSVLGLATLGIAVFFYDLPFTFLAGSALAAFGFLVWGEMLSRGELQNTMNIKFFKAVRPQLNKLITAMAFLAVLLYLPQWSATGDLISPAAFERIYGFSARVTTLLYPELNLNSSVEAFSKSFAGFQLKTNLAFLQLLPAAKERAVTEATKQVLTRFTEWANVEVSPLDPLSSLFYKVFVKNLASWQEKLGDQLLFVWGIIIFFLVRGVGGILHLVVSGVAFFIYQSLIAANFIKVVGESRMHETLEYS